MEDGEAADGETPRRKPLIKELSQQCIERWRGPGVCPLKGREVDKKTSMIRDYRSLGMQDKNERAYIRLFYFL